MNNGIYCQGELTIASVNWRRVCCSLIDVFLSVLIKKILIIIISILLLSIRLMPICTFIEVSKQRLQVHCLIAFIPSYWSPTRIILKVWYDCLPLIRTNSTIIHNQKHIAIFFFIARRLCSNQCGPRSDSCPRGSLIRVHNVCLYSEKSH